MILRLCLSMCLAVPGLASLAVAAEASPDIYGETTDETAARTGYTVAEIQKFFPPIERWQQFGIEPKPDRLADSFARDRFKAPPPPGVHPRVYFNPEDVPALRERIKRSHVFGDLMAGIRGRLLQISPNQQDWESVPYKPTEEDYRRFASLGKQIEARAGYRGPWVGGWVNELAAGRVPKELDETWSNRPGQQGGKHYMMHLLPYEAFRCLIDDDAEGGRRVGAALATICRRFQQDIARFREQNNWQSFYQEIQSQSLGLTYDWAHPWMTDEQRAIARQTIADMTAGKSYLGQNHLPAFPGNTSNWNIIHANLLPMVLSIEGEEGYDPAVYRRIVEGLKKWVYVASGPDGAPFEGLKKSAYAPWWLIPLAKRGDAFLGTEYCRNHARKFLLHTMLPWGGDHVFETGIGPLQKDIVAFKYAHPTDPVIDLLYAGTVKDRFPGSAVGPWPNIRTTYPPPWWQLIVGEDPIGAEGNTYDYARAFDRVTAQLQAAEPLSYYSDYRGLLTARSGWHREAVMLYFEPRNVPGGHTRASRNEFVLAAHGRLWAHRTEAVEDTSELHSVVLVDGRGQGKSGGRCPMGRTLAVVEKPEAVFAAADARWAYGHVLVSADHKDAMPVTVTPNDARLVKSRLPWMDQPWNFLPNWATGCKPLPKQDPGGHGYWIPYNPVEYAYRSLGLVRGARPYVLVIDDIRKDADLHQYDWLMQMPDDVKLVERTARTPGKDGVVDLLFADEQGRKLLVRVLAAGASAQEAAAQDAAAVQSAAKLENYETEYRGTVTRRQRLVLPLRATVGHFVVLLYPFKERDPTPETAWHDGGRLTVALPDVKDELTLSPAPDGRTRVTFRRGDRAVAALE